MFSARNSASAHLLTRPVIKPVLDSAAKDVSQAAMDYARAHIRLNAVAIVQAWVEESSFDEGETSADRLLMMLVGIADADKNGELSDEEAELVEDAVSAATDFMLTKGVAQEDLDTLFASEDLTAAGEAGDRVHEFLKDIMPTEDDEAGEEMDAFAFDGESATEPALDAAVYKRKMVIRAGKKAMIRARISGTVRLSGAQKLGLRKARMKSQSAVAMMRRARSMKRRTSMGLRR